MGYVGTYDRTIFYNPSNKYCIISVKTSDQSVPQQARSAYRHRDNMIRFIAVGYELPQTDKVSMILDGEWENGKHGVQLQVDKCEEIVPQTKEGVYGYLSSRLIKGVGEKTAALIVNRFGADALRVLENEPERLLEIRGITPDKLEDIKASYAESRCVRDLMILLTPFNVTQVPAMKIYEHFGSRSVDILQKNPYELCQVSGFGFKRVDAIVRKGDLPLNSPMRIHGAVFAALDTGRNEKGHLFLEEDALANGTHTIIESEDMDKYRNEAACKGALKLHELARKYGMVCRGLNWNPNYKGVDDWQLALKRNAYAKEDSRKNFRQRFMYGLCDFEVIDDDIAQWHETAISVALILSICCYSRKYALSI